MEKWLRENLSICFTGMDFDVPDEMVKYILSIKTSTELNQYFDSLLDLECEEHRLFLQNCEQRLFSKALPNKKSGQPVQFQKQGAHGPGQKPIKQHGGNSTAPAGKQAELSVQQQQSQGAKKKTKFVSLYASDGKVQTDTIMLKGRRTCECQASQHKLVNNCMSCGRIVCEQEGSGPCLFCGEIVCTNEEQQLMRTDIKKGEQLLKTLREKGGGGGGEAMRQALEQRDRLLEYDRNSEKRTTVIDDELDYFQENSVWLSDVEREKFERLKQELHEKKHAGRAQRKIRVDFAGRAINEDDELPVSVEYERSVLQQLADATAATADSSNWSNRQYSQQVTPDTCNDPKMSGLRPVYKATLEGNNKTVALQQTLASDGLECVYNRVQDKQLLEMQDMRQCLSMHQPWASLLVAGIKQHEGRVWYSGHRGRLWIASTSKEPHKEDIQELENFYKKHYNDPHIKFPENYPTSCLLGCVIVEDCLAQEEYREFYPTGESDSPYVFICNSPVDLPVCFPIKGQPKIYQIDPQLHNTACKTLLRMKATKG